MPGDVNDPAARAALVAAAGGRVDLLVHNAGELGPSPLPPLAAYPADALRAVLETTLLAPLQLTQLALPALRAARGTVVTLSSDAAVEAYPGWGGYGAAKAALDHYAAVLGVEESDLAVYAFDPGDMRTAMHQRAFPGEDISDRPEPETVVPAFLRLVDERPPVRSLPRRRSGRACMSPASTQAFTVPPELSAAAPPEARGVPRDGVRLLVARPGRPLRHLVFSGLPGVLRRGDLLVVNDSDTEPAALDGHRADGRPVVLHVSGPTRRRRRVDRRAAQP